MPRFSQLSFRSLRGIFVALALLVTSSLAAATITVNSNADAAADEGACTLREAIIAANTHAASGATGGECVAGASGLDTVNFSIGSGAQTITVLTTPLPTIVEPISINGYTQPGGSAANTAASGDNSTHLITLSGASLPSNLATAWGLVLGPGSSGSTIRGLVINRFVSGGIQVRSSDNLIAGNYVGTDAAGTAANVGNGSSDFFGGIVIRGNGSAASGNTIGGSAPADRNVVGGNFGGSQIEITRGNAATDGNTVLGNIVGTNAAGTASFFTVATAATRGIEIGAATNTTIGGTTGTTPGGACTGACNLISGNQYGVLLLGDFTATGGANTSIVGNFIGTNAGGTAGIGNRVSAISMGQAPAGPITIGGTTASARNVLASRGAADAGGIGIDAAIGGSPAGTVFTIQGNYIGTNSAGTAALGFGDLGIKVQASVGVLIGGTTGSSAGACTGACNIISGNGYASSPAAQTGHGIAIIDATANTVQGNYIGLGSDGSPLGNNGAGVAMPNNGGFPSLPNDNVIGAATSGGAGGNVIAYNGAGMANAAGIIGFAGLRNKVLSNSIYANNGSTTSLAIDWGQDGVSANDNCDTDAGFSFNSLQNFPVLTSASFDGSQVTIAGTLNSTASTAFRVEFFANPASDPQARTFLGSTVVNTNASCTGSFSVSFPATAPESITATATDPIGNTSEVSAAVAVPLMSPTVAKSFTPPSVTTGVPSTLTITLTNANASPITGVAFTDNYPANLINASPAGGATTCGGGSVTAANGGGAVALSSGTIPANGSCTVTVSVLSNTSGSYLNSLAAGSVTTGNAGSNASPATATLTVTALPTITKAFSPNPAGVGADVALTITLGNGNASSLNSAAFTDNYPSGLVNTATPNGSTTCSGGSVTALAGGTSVALSGGTIPAGGTCTVTVTVSPTVTGNLVNTIGAGALTTSGGSNAAAATDTLVSLAPPTVSKGFAPSNIAPGATSTLTITLANSNGVAITNAAFTDTYPAQITNAATPAGSTTCGGGSITAAAGGGSVALSGGTIPAGGTCTVTVTVTDSTVGTHTNAIPAGGVTSSASTNTAAATSNLSVNAPPTVAKAFSPTTIAVGTSSTLTITLTNPNPVPLTGTAFTDTYPAGLVNASTPAGATTCAGGTVTANAGGPSVALSGGTIPAGGSCTVTVMVTSNSINSYPNTLGAGAVTTLDSGPNPAASSTATLTVSNLNPPTVTKAFLPASFGQGNTTTLTITLSNSNASAITGTAFTDTYPAGLVNASTPAGATTCAGGTVTANAGGPSVALSGGTIPANGTCTVTVTVTAAAPGSYANSIPAGNVTSANAGSSTAAASATANATATVGIDVPLLSPIILLALMAMLAILGAATLKH